MRIGQCAGELCETRVRHLFVQVFVKEILSYALTMLRRKISDIYSICKKLVSCSYDVNFIDGEKLTLMLC